MKRIVYKNPDNSVSILIPAKDCIDRLVAQTGDSRTALLLIADKDVPAGLPYWVVDTDTIPTDRTFREAWELPADMPEPDGHGGDEFVFPEEVLS